MAVIDKNITIQEKEKVEEAAELTSRKKTKEQRRKAVLKKLSDIIYFFIMPIIVILIWQWGSAHGYINPHILPSPSKEVETVINQVSSGKLQIHLLISGYRVVRGFAVGAFLGIVIGSIMGLSFRVHKLFISLVGIFRPIPMIAWIPLLILWLGIGDDSKIAVIAIGSFWPVLLNTIQGIQGVDQKLIDVATIMEKSRWEIVTEVIFPAALPSVFTGIRLGVSSAWSCVVAAEMIGASEGIGFLITYARELTQPHVMIVGVFSIGIVGLLIDTIILKLQKALLKWSVINE